MGLKMFDLPPGGLADGAVAEVDKENSTSADIKPEIIIKEVPVEVEKIVEKIVEKEVIKEVPVEKKLVLPKKKPPNKYKSPWGPSGGRNG